MKNRRIAAAALCAALLLAGPGRAWCWPQEAAPPADERVASKFGPDLSEGEAQFDRSAKAELDVKRSKTGHLLVRPIINGKDGGWYIFDTGAGISVVSTPHADQYDLKPAGSVAAVGVGGAEGANLFRVEKMVLGPMTLNDQPVITSDLSFLREHLGDEISGVIGYGVLKKCVAEVDLDAGKIRLYDPSTFALREGEWSAMPLEGRIPTVPAKFEGREGRFRLDIGANESVTFFEPAVRKWKLLEGRELTDAKAGGVGGFVATKRGVLTSFEIGGLKRENLMATFTVNAKGSSGDSDYDGRIGIGVLKPFVLVLDYAGERIAFRLKHPA